MLKLYTGSVKFLENESRMLGEDHPRKTASQTSRVRHFVSNLAVLPKDMDDATAVQAALAEESPQFTVEQRKEMLEAVSLHMSSDTAESSDTTRQTHMYLHNWLPDTLWKKLLDDKMTVDEKLENFVDFALEVVGLRYPTDATLKTILSITAICHQWQMTPTEAYNKIRNLSDKFVNKRPLVAGKPLMITYESDPSPFMRLHPRRYMECDPPVASKVDEREIQKRTRKDVMPTRDTNKQLKTNNQKASGGAASGGNFAEQFSMKALDYMLGSKIAAPRLGDQQAPPAAPLAIEDVNRRPAGDAITPALPAASPAVQAAQQQGAPPSTIAGILAQAKATFAKPAKGTKADKKAMKAMKGKKNPLVPSTEAEDEDEDEDEEENEGDGDTDDEEEEEEDEGEEEEEEDEDEEEEEEEDDEDEEEEEEEDDEDEEEEEESSESVQKKPSSLQRKPAAFKKPSAAIVVKEKVKKAKGKVKKAMKSIVEKIKDKRVHAAIKKTRVSSKAYVAPDGVKPKPRFTPTHYAGGKIYFSESKKVWRVYRRQGDKIEVHTSPQNLSMLNTFPLFCFSFSA